jgi:Baseplate J-like protein
MTDFIDAVINVDPATLADNAIDAYTSILQANGFPGYSPNDGDAEIIEFTVIAEMFGDVASLAAQMPAAAFRQFGTRLAGIPYAQGSFATMATTWTLVNAPGTPIPGGTFVTVAGQGFYVVADTPASPGNSVVGVILIAVDIGTAYNDLLSPIAPVNQINWVISISAVNPSSGGADPEDDATFQNGLAAELELQAPRPITASDFAAFVLTPSAVNATGVTVGRSTSIDGFDPGVYVFTGTTNATTTVSAVSSFSGVTPGTALSGANVQPNTTVVSINPTGSTLVMSLPATGSATAQSLTATGSYGNQREVSVFVTDINGLPFAGASTTTTSGPACLALQAWLQGFREVNFLVNVLAPSTTSVYVTGQIHVLPGYDVGMTLANAQEAVLTYLNPATWGNPASRGAFPNQWLNAVQGFSYVRYNSIVGIIENVAGVQYVPPGSAGLAIGFSPSPSGTSDLILPGPAPLATSDPTTILITAI